MMGVGWTEMLVIGVVALIVIGPKELPALMQRLGRFAGTVRRMGADFQRELNKTTGLDEVRNLRNAITQPLKQTTDAIRKEFNTTTTDGAVKPSGALKPADPAADSVVKEIHAAAGMPVPAEPIKTAPVKIEPIGAPAGQEKAARPAVTASAASASPSSPAPAIPAPKAAKPRKPRAGKKPDSAAVGTEAAPAPAKRAAAKPSSDGVAADKPATAGRKRATKKA